MLYYIIDMHFVNVFQLDWKWLIEWILMIINIKLFKLVGSFLCIFFVAHSVYRWVYHAHSVWPDKFMTYKTVSSSLVPDWIFIQCFFLWLFSFLFSLMASSIELFWILEMLSIKFVGNAPYIALRPYIGVHMKGLEIKHNNK